MHNIDNNSHKLLKLDFNENSLGMADSAKEAIANALSGAARYPDKHRATLLSKVAAINGVFEIRFYWAMAQSRVSEQWCKCCMTKH